MRQIVLDTETTGLNVRTGDRIIEIGCVEIVNRRLTGRNWHQYLNPGRKSDPDALRVHGIEDDFLLDKPKFEAVADELLAFCEGAEIIIHNADFDVGFLDEELKNCGRAAFRHHCARVCDTLEMSKQLSPGKRHNLDALCERYGVSNAHRTLHGALLDAELLAEVYLAMTRGQDSLVIDLGAEAGVGVERIDFSTLDLVVVRASEAEIAAHEAVLDTIAKESRGTPLWRVVTASPPVPVPAGTADEAAIMPASVGG